MSNVRQFVAREAVREQVPVLAGGEMSDTKELLELAARAMPLDIVWKESVSSRTGAFLEIEHTKHAGFWVGARKWNPLTNSGDCAEMCAALGIATTWTPILVCVELKGRLESEYFKDHNNDRTAAWRMAALRVAAAIGEAMK